MWQCSTSPRGVIEQTGTPDTFMMYDLVMDLNTVKKQPYDVQQGLYPLGCFTTTTTIVKSFFNEYNPPEIVIDWGKSPPEMRVTKTDKVNADSLIHYKIYDTFAGTDYFINDFFVLYREWCDPWGTPTFTKGTSIVTS